MAITLRNAARKRLSVERLSVTCALAADPAVDAAAPVWVQVAEEGLFKGYNGGETPFKFDANVFNQLVANFHKHPSFKPGADGTGAEDVVAWDFQHASEKDPTDGNIAVQGAPAQGWVRDLQVRLDAATNRAQLWALTRWLEPAQTYIKEKRYQWASVSVVFGAVDPRSGENVGAVLTSVALTNQPFIEGMVPLAASRAFAIACGGAIMYLEPACNAEEALETIRRMLGMTETADAASVLGELAKLKQWVESGATPIGVDVDDIIGGLRRVLNLPALSDTTTVFTEVDKLVSSLVSQETGGSTAPVQPPPPAAPATVSMERIMEPIKLIAEKLGVIATLDAVVEALDTLIELCAVEKSALKLEKSASNKVVLKATVDDAAVRAKYVAILGALGVEAPDGALDKIAELIKQGEDLKSVAPELAALRKQAAATAETEADAEVDSALATMGIASTSQHFTGLRDALKLSHKADPAAFRTRYPAVKQPPAEQVALTQRVAANPTTGAGTRVDLSLYPGRNKQERAIAHIKATVKGADSWSWEQLNEAAWNLMRATG